MPVTNLNSNDVGLFISTNTVTPVYKEIVCGTDITLEGSIEVTKVSTKCGPVISVGEPEFTASAGGAANVTPGGTELSSTELLAIFQAGQDVLVQIKDRVDPTKFYRQGTAKMSSYTEDLPESGLVTFDISFDFAGVLDVTS